MQEEQKEDSLRNPKIPNGIFLQTMLIWGSQISPLSRLILWNATSTAPSSINSSSNIVDRIGERSQFRKEKNRSKKFLLGTTFLLQVHFVWVFATFLFVLGGLRLNVYRKYPVVCLYLGLYISHLFKLFTQHSTRIFRFSETALLFTVWKLLYQLYNNFSLVFLGQFSVYQSGQRFQALPRLTLIFLIENRRKVHLCP